METAPAQAATRIAERRRAFVRGLLWSLAVFAVLSSWLWGVRFHSWYAVAVSFIAPPYAAIDFTLRADTDMAVVSWLVTLAASGFVLCGWLRPHPALTCLAHLSLAAYWLWSFMLIGIGV
ncbi:MAG TPA: hypothetical protein VFD43_01330 [Planctomycetota bacterium]|nr:hypothetical protein [Planctomycetota bacterium]